MASKFEMVARRTPTGGRFKKQFEKAVDGQSIHLLPVDCVDN